MDGWMEKSSGTSFRRVAAQLITTMFKGRLLRNIPIGKGFPVKFYDFYLDNLSYFHKEFQC